MRAMILKQYGSIDQFSLAQLPMPVPQGGEVRVKVCASAVGPADYKVASGVLKILHGRNFPMILGYDFSGSVDAVGPGETRWKVGDSVFGFLPYNPGNNQGAFAEFLIAKSSQIAERPLSLSHAQAAAVATAGLTALQAIRDLGGLPKPDSRVLITGASGGVGATAISVARKLGAQVAVVGSRRGLDLARQQGAADIIDRTKGDVIETAQGPFDVVFDAAATYRWKQWKGKLKNGGAFVTTLPSINFAKDKVVSAFSASSAKFVGVKAKTEDLELLAKWFHDGTGVVIDSTFPVRSLAEAFKRYKSGDFLGRIVVDVENGF